MHDSIVYYVLRFRAFSSQELPKPGVDSVCLVTLHGFLLLIYPVLPNPM